MYKRIIKYKKIFLTSLCILIAMAIIEDLYNAGEIIGKFAFDILG